MASARAKRVKPERQIRVGFLGPSVRLSGDLVDLSETGALIRCSEGVDLDVVGRLGIDVGNEVLRTLAVVRRKVPGVGVAVQISHMTPRDRDLLHRLLFRLGWHSAW